MRLRYSVALAAGILSALGLPAQALPPRSSAPASPGESPPIDRAFRDTAAAGPTRTRSSALETLGARQQLSAQEKQIETLTQKVQELSLQRDRAQLRGAFSADGAAPAGAAVRPFATPSLRRSANAEVQQADLALRNLQQQPAASPVGATPAELQRQLELQRKQIELLEKMVRLLAGQIEQQSPALSDVQTQVATLSARSQQAAQRDQQLAAGIDNLTDQFDAQMRYGPSLPAPLSELFLPSGTNETAFSIYNALSVNYSYFPSQPGAGQFAFGEYAPIFLLQLNNQFLFESELEFHTNGEVEIGYAQMDWTVADGLTVVGGRYLAPIGFFNERLHTPWINKMPDFPLMMRTTTLADFSLTGAQLRGSRYLLGSPVKMEYSLYAANGLGMPGGGTLTDWANLGKSIETTKNANNSMAYGGRVGFWIPAVGLYGGASYFGNSAYTPSAGADTQLWDFDLSFRQGNWDVRFEYAALFQKTAAFIGNNIGRNGLYVQAAYRDYTSLSPILSNLELVGRYSYATIRGVDPFALDLSAFDSPVQVPVTRNQYALGVNYYLSYSLILKLAFEVNQETRFNLKDNQLLSQLAWGF